MANPIKTTILESNSMMKMLMAHFLKMDGGIDVVGYAEDTNAARALVKETDPDAIVLDVNLEGDKGFVFLKNLMRLRPTPVVALINGDPTTDPLASKARNLGAVDVLQSPLNVPPLELEAYAANLVARVKSAAATKVEAVGRPVRAEKAAPIAPATDNGTTEEPIEQISVESIIAIGSSTGGNSALRDIIAALPADLPPIVIVQHIPSEFSESFANGLDRISKVKVLHARQSMPLYKGHAYIAPGDSHMVVGRTKNIRLTDQGLCNGHKPSVEILFDSVTKHYGDKACAVMLTGMGNDGAEAMLRMREAGIKTYAQDEKTSVVWGMPGSAVKLGAVDRVLPLNRIASAISASAHELLHREGKK